MADATTTYAVDNSAEVNVVAQTVCERIVVQENYTSAAGATTDLLQKMPLGATNAVIILKGTPAIYTPLSRRNPNAQPYFLPGEIAGTIKTSSGSITVQQVEGQQI